MSVLRGLPVIMAPACKFAPFFHHVFPSLSPARPTYGTSVKMPSDITDQPVCLIVASTMDMGIGFEGSLPWKLKSELAYFAKMTKTTKDPSKKNAVIVGRKTWESIPLKFRPLKDRINIVLSSRELDLGSKTDDVFHCYSFHEAINAVRKSPLREKVEKVWIIGGAKVYKTALEEGFCDKIYWTQIFSDYECDTFMPKWDSNFIECSDPDVPDEVQEEGGVKFKYSVLKSAKV